MRVDPVPEGFHTVTPYLMVQGAAGLLDFMRDAFGAELVTRSDWPDGSVMHAMVRIGDSPVMLSDARGEWGPMPAMLYLYVDDVDEVHRRAVAAGGRSLREPTDEFYGDRSGGVADAWGNQWWVATHVEDLTPDEMARREQAFREQRPPA